MSAPTPISDAPYKTVDLPQGTVRYRESGAGEPLVFVHGLLMSGLVWDQVADALSGEFRCILPEFPLGSHTIPLRAGADCSPLGVAKLADDFMQALDLKAVTLIGNDSGGAISQMVAAHHPERLGRLVLTPCDCYENFLPPAFRYLQLAARVPLMPDLLVQSMRIPGMARTPIAFGWLGKRRIAPELLAAWLGPPMKDRGIRRDLTALLRKISAKDTLAAVEILKSTELPVLVAWAPEDRFFTMKYGERLVRDIPGARLEKIEDSYTLVGLDQPKRTAQLIAEFVHGVPSAAGPVREAVE
jgi:pimeloyl-ACP methyl ester carboxylesterase